MRLGTRDAKPITEIAGWILIEVDDVCYAAIDREIARAARSDISDAGRGPAEHILRPKIVATETEPRPKTHDLIYFMLGRTLRVVVAAAGRPGELKLRCRIKRNDSIIRPALANTAFCEHRRWRVPPHCPRIRTRHDNVRG